MSLGAAGRIQQHADPSVTSAMPACVTVFSVCAIIFDSHKSAGEQGAGGEQETNATKTQRKFCRGQK